mmetsp:Transcript_37251/g.90404  ORF Transcript_37251/g.90404 Transcript_37251/m.90404 type:complete len:659 (-) Transcript_37251:1036-3012(-)
MTPTSCSSTPSPETYYHRSTIMSGFKHRETTIHFEDEENDKYAFKTQKTPELLGRDEPFLDFQGFSEAGKEQISNIQEDVKEMLEPIVNGLNPFVGNVGKMIHRDFVPIFQCKQNPSTVGGPPTSLAAVARGQAPSCIIPRLATKLTARENNLNKPRITIHHAWSTEIDSISRMTPPRGNLSTVGSNGDFHHHQSSHKDHTAPQGDDDKKKVQSKSCRKKFLTKKAVPGRESTDKMKQRLMKPQAEKTIFERFTEASSSIRDTPKATSEEHKTSQNLPSIETEKKDREEEKTNLKKESEQPSSNTNAKDTVRTTNATAKSAFSPHEHSGTRPESPIMLFSFGDDDEYFDSSQVLSSILDDCSQEVLDQESVLEQEELIGTAESVIAAAEQALTSSGRKLIWSAESPTKDLPDEPELQSNESKEVAELTSQVAQSVQLTPFGVVEQRDVICKEIEDREHIQTQVKDEERDSCNNIESHSQRVTDNGERDPVVSSKDVSLKTTIEKAIKESQHSPSSRPFLNNVQPLQDTNPTYRKQNVVYGKPVLVSRRFLSDIDSSDDETDTSAHMSSTSYSRGSNSYSDYTSQWEYETSRHSAYSTDVSSLLYSGRGGRSSSVGYSTSMEEITDIEGSTDEEDTLVTQDKDALFFPFQSFPLSPPQL